MTNETHIVRAFDRDLQALQALLARMGALVEAALLNAARALEQMDREAAETVIAGDAAIDALDEQINLEAASLIARRAPTARDLRLVLAVMRAAHSLERVGDYARNAAKRMRAMTANAPVEGTAGTIRRMATHVTRMLDESMQALVRQDAGLAASVRARDLDIDQMYNTLFRSLLTFMLESPANISTCMHLHFIAKNIERAGDHATSIAEQAIYLATGHLPGEDRPKADLTSVPKE